MGLDAGQNSREKRPNAKADIVGPINHRWSPLIVVRIGFDQELFERYEVCDVSLKSRMSRELVRIEVHLVHDVATSAFFCAAPSEEFNPFVVGGRSVLDELPEGIIIMRGDEWNAEDFVRHTDTPEASPSCR